MNLNLSPTKRLYFTQEYNDGWEKLLEQAGFRPQCTMETLEDWLEIAYRKMEYMETEAAKAALLQDRKATVYALNPEGKLVGRITFHYLETSHPAIEIRILPQERRKGYGYELLSAAVDCVFHQFAYDYLCYDLEVENAASRQLIKKLGGTLHHKSEFVEFYRIYNPSNQERNRPVL